MQVQENAAPAGAGEGTATSVAAVAEMIADNEEREAPSAPAASEAPDTTAAAETETAEETATEEGAAPVEGKPETDVEPTETFAHGNALVRLRDGSTRRVGELKKLVDLEPELTRRSSEVQAIQRQLATKQAQIAQQEQFFSRTVPYALQILRQHVPPEPDAKLLQTDFLAHYEQKTRREDALAQLRQMEAAAAAHQQQTHVQAQEQQKAYLAWQQNALLEKFPDLKSPERRVAFRAGVLETATRYGFTEAEIDAAADHRIFHLVHDLAAKAKAYDALMAKKPVADKKPASTTQVQAPGRRATPTDAASAKRAELFQRAQTRGGRIEDIAALIAANEPD